MTRGSLGLVLLVWLALGCGSAKREAASLAAAVDRYRAAKLDARAPLAQALEAVACTDAEVCAAKTACLASARPTVQGEALMHAVRVALDDLDAGRLTTAEASTRSLPGKLDEASRLLAEGQASLPSCDARILALKAKYGL